MCGPNKIKNWKLISINQITEKEGYEVKINNKS